MRPAYRSGDPRPEALMRVILSLMLLLAVACQPSVIGPGGGAPSTPANLTYQLEPSGDPSRPLGILLIWDDVTDANRSEEHTSELQSLAYLVCRLLLEKKKKKIQKLK